MKGKRFVILNVFAETHFGGNQLAVLPDASGLSDSVMQSLARQFNLPETTFVFPPLDPGHDAQVRIFTPAVELPFAGHPTVGTAVALARLGRGAGSWVLEEAVGPVPVTVRFEGDDSFAEFTLSGKIEVPEAVPDLSLLGAALSLSAHDLVDAWYGSAGVPICFAHLADKAAVDRAVLNRGAWADGLTAFWSPNLYIFSGQPRVEKLYGRFFAPALGVDEDPATGAAVAALVGSLAKRLIPESGIIGIKIEQGVRMGRPSVIEASAEVHEGKVLKVSVSGQASIIAEGTIFVPR